MTATLMQTVRDWNIRRKILTGFAVVLLITGVLGGFAIRSLDRMHAAVLAGGVGTEELYRNSRMLIIVVLGVAVVSGVLIALFLARLIADPLTKLGLAAEEVSKGDLTIEIRSTSRDEIGWWSI